MNLINLFELQENLDEVIRKEHGLEGESLLSQKTLALQVEIGELANATRCFKFWSNNKILNDKIILEQLANSLYFMLSLGLEKKFNDIVDIKLKESRCNITSQFLNLYVDINDFLVCSSKDHYITLFEDFLSLGSSLGFTPNEIKKCYNKIYMNTHYISEKQYS
ncbi:MAG: dUTP diphosphatase [Clostridium sp.]|jgi:dimeric dUTPase (all-alpha-NTP-PPase superfamily)|uniref:dUTP diphosphatase n=1 Tax=Clostridium sp. TaxID=1506 RepID=UPI0025C5DAF1|nr:dUTP diphosphatase [Clostridium sp.]MCH3965578.1 dUTP diphosphatase [Clostridium sp.]MCI1716906.1 dUTP diphosphatase [Clostridium sp.]MCI1801164.1 dUTP diphosphatase [Clostridium sp.]MCI1815092.1 dUTP diphosphatase [Clostridium sp.]MCI1871995.1 dUTP diphosphatase [Clostridium sp.]